MDSFKKTILQYKQGVCYLGNKKLSKGKTVIVYRNPNAVARNFPHLEAK
jgi:hypothetical protein